uniref:Uncharacterized protein n=1 Tax=Arundo donax TaxID=35708 RepID=A0A0A9AY46_ARUDO
MCVRRACSAPDGERTRRVNPLQTKKTPGNWKVKHFGKGKQRIIPWRVKC